jgi:hypothetical protein
MAGVHAADRARFRHERDHANVGHGRQVRTICIVTRTAMRDDEPLKLRVGRTITPEQFELLSDEQLARLVPKAYREFFPGKDFCADGHFYLHDGTAWCFFRGGFLDE